MTINKVGKNDSQQAMDSLDVPICLLDPKGIILQCNTAMNKFALEILKVKKVQGEKYYTLLGNKSPSKNCPFQISKNTLDKVVKTYNFKDKIIRIGAEPIVNIDGSIKGVIYVLKEIQNFNFEFEKKGYQVIVFKDKGDISYISKGLKDYANTGSKIGTYVKLRCGKVFSLNLLKEQQGLIETKTGYVFVTTLKSYPDYYSYTRLEYEVTDLLDLKQMTYKDSQKFKSVFEYSPNLNIIISNEGIIEDVNKTIVNFFGYSRNDLIGKNVIDFVKPDMIDNVNQAIINDFSGKGNGEMHVSVITKHNKEKIIFFPQSYATLIFENKKPISMILSGVDVTESSANAKQFEETRIILSTLVESLPDAVYLKDKNMKYLKVNREFENMHQKLRSKIIGKKDSTVFNKKISVSNLKYEKDCISNGFPTKSVIEVGKKYYETLRTPIYDGSGNFDGLIGVSRDITDDVQINSDLKASEKNYMEMFDAAHDGLVVISKSYMITDANLSALNMFGLSKGQILKATISDLSKTKEKLVFKHIRSSLSGKPQMFEWSFLKNDGTMFWSEVSMRRVVINNKFQCLAVIRDITSRKLVEKEILVSKEKYKTIFDNSPEAIVVIDSQGYVTAANSIIEKWLGFTIKSVIGKHVLKVPFITSAGKKIVMSGFKNRMLGENFEPYVVEFLTSKGEIEYGRIQGNLLKDFNGKTFADLVFVSNITAQMKNENRLIESEKKFRLAFENSQDAILWFDIKTGIILNCNGAAEKLFQYSKSVLIGMNQSNLNFLTNNKRDEDFFENIRNNSGKIIHSELGTKNKKNKYISISITNTTFENKKIIQAIFKDTTSQIEAEKSAVTNKNILSRLMNSFPGMAYRCLVDEHWTMVVVSDGSKDLIGYQPFELINNKIISYNKIIHPTDRQRVNDSVEKAIKGNLKFKITYRVITKSGKIRWVFEQGFIVINDKNKLKHIEGFILDITERISAENEIKDRNSELENFNKFAIGRELKMIDLKRKILTLENKLKRYTNAKST